MGGVDLYFGWRTAILTVAGIQIVVLAFAITGQARNRVANGLLAAFLIMLAGVLAPYAIGFAGAYDAWRCLTFAPLPIPMALPPLLYGYTHALVRGARPARFWIHLTLPAVEFLYGAICFLLPIDAKWDWYTGGHRRWIEPALDAAVLVSFAAYAVASLRLLRTYRAALAEQRSDDDRFATDWLARVIVALVGTLCAYAVFTVWDVVAGGIDFFQETGLYLLLAAAGVYLGIEGWRHAALPFPILTEPAGPEPAAQPDWEALARDYDARVRAAGWAKEPDLSLPALARRLATNTGRLSRAINQGLGVNFSAWINGLRAEAVAEALDAGSDADLLTLAFDAGFASKASFNRAFQAHHGVAPSRYRRGVSHRDFQDGDAVLRRAAR